MGRVLIALGIVLLAIQLVPIDRANPPETGRVAAPAEVVEVLEQSCYDCHSNHSRWPWYGYVAPASWLVAWDIAEAREHMNFSEWDRLDAEERADAIHEVWEEVEEGEMPLWYYLPLHPEARLDAADREALRAWAEAEGSQEVDADAGHEH